MWTHDVRQAYLQSKDMLNREIYLRPAKELNVPPGTLLKLQRPLYGLSDAGDYWAVTLSDHFCNDLQMTTGPLPAFHAP